MPRGRPPARAGTAIELHETRLAAYALIATAGNGLAPVNAPAKPRSRHVPTPRPCPRLALCRRPADRRRLRHARKPDTVRTRSSPPTPCRLKHTNPNPVGTKPPQPLYEWWGVPPHALGQGVLGDSHDERLATEHRPPPGFPVSARSSTVPRRAAPVALQAPLRLRRRAPTRAASPRPRWCDT